MASSEGEEIMEEKDRVYLQGILSKAILSDRRATDILCKEGFNSLYDVMNRLQKVPEVTS